MGNAVEESFSAVAVQDANAMPAPTWHRLRVNSQQVSLPAGLETCSECEVELDGVLAGSESAFDEALSQLQEVLDSTRTPQADERAVVDAAKGAAEAGDLDIPALSRYQRKAVLEEVANDVAAAFETGMGAEAYGYLEAAADGRIVLFAPAESDGRATLRLLAQDGFANAVCVDVVAQANSRLSLTISYEGSEGTGFVGCGLRVFAGKNAEVEISSIQALDDSWTVFDDSGYVLDEGSHVSVAHRVLGGGSASTGLAADLRGAESRIDVTTRYLGAGQQERDFNYSIKQRGCATESNLDANGVLAGESKKTLRGTIDFVYGCKGSTGNERETVLLADEGVENKTVPVILCDEDDVMGNHGATIGHVRPEQRFYLACRGLSDRAIESLFSVAALEEAHMAFSDGRIKQQVSRLAAAKGIDAADFSDAEEGE